MIHIVLAVFGLFQMMRKAFPYTLAKAGCLLSGTFFMQRVTGSPYYRDAGPDTRF
jgi:adiponectin receptor